MNIKTDKTMIIFKVVMTIAEIKEIFSKYIIDYDIKDKIIIVREPMLVDDFVYLRLLVSQLKEKTEIMVRGNRESRIYEKKF